MALCFIDLNSSFFCYLPLSLKIDGRWSLDVALNGGVRVNSSSSSVRISLNQFKVFHTTYFTNVKLRKLFPSSDVTCNMGSLAPVSHTHMSVVFLSKRLRIFGLLFLKPFLTTVETFR